MARIPTRQGTVKAFDAEAGLGTLVDDSDQSLYPFHCTAMTDGSRMIDVDQRVSFRVVAGGGGRWEATLITDLVSATRCADVP